MRKSFVLTAFLIVLLLNGISAFAEDDLQGRRVYALGAPYLTITDDIAFNDLQALWNGSADAEPETQPASLAIGNSSLDELISIFGSEPDPAFVSVLSDEALQKTADTQDQWVIVPFEAIDPRWKMITLDGESILSNQFDPNKWPLTATIGNADGSVEELPVLNRDAEKLTNVVLTGVTAMVRSTAQYMDLDPLYPASLIREPLINADILHVNNEVPFAPVCNETEEQLSKLQFCSRPAYMALLQDIGTDVVELDGDHFQDFGDDAVLYTLDLYDEVGMPYYGGGHNREEAQKPLIMEHNGNRFAFLGCNGKEIGYAAASDTRPGAVHCDIDLMVDQIHELKEEGIIPIVTFQHLEVYKDKPVDVMRADFEAVHDAGAVIVSGSQSHIPMEFDVYPDSFIHFGLGNLFFDQAFFLPETAVATIDRHTFYDGKYIGTELLSIRFTNCALSHYMDETDRAALLSRMFESSVVAGSHD